MILDGYLGSYGRTYKKDGTPVVVRIRRGDIIWFSDIGHYGAIYRDRSIFFIGNGKLDMFDEMIHTLGKTKINKLWRIAGIGIIRYRQRIQIFRF